MEVLSLDYGDEEVLPVFSYEEEAEMFLLLGDDVDDGWRVRETGAEELISVLYGPCAGAKKVALDPLPEMMTRRTVGLVSLDRDRFIERIVARTSRSTRPGT